MSDQKIRAKRQPSQLVEVDCKQCGTKFTKRWRVSTPYPEACSKLCGGRLNAARRKGRPLTEVQLAYYIRRSTGKRKDRHTCPECGREFLRYRSPNDTRPAFRCSAACSNRFNSKRPEVKKSHSLAQRRRWDLKGRKVALSAKELAFTQSGAGPMTCANHPGQNCSIRGDRAPARIDFRSERGT